MSAINIKEKLADDLSKVMEIESAEIRTLLEIPPDKKMGDIALPCFKLAKKFKKSPQNIANDIMIELTLPEYIERAEIVGGFLNFYLNRLYYIRATLEKISEAGEFWGSSNIGEGKTIVIDYSSVNIAKPFHIGHLSSTAIGGALYKIYKYLGYNTVGVNHLGDWGTQFGKLIAAYKLWGNKEDIEKRSISALLELYVRFHKEAEVNETLNEDGRAWFKKIEDGEAEALEIFQWFKDITLKEAQKIYDKLNINFDSYAGESFYNDKVDAVVEELREKGLTEESEGAIVVRLDDQKLPPALILKSDGATLYATRDLAAAEYRKETYDFYKNLYVVAYQQNLHFKQIFSVLKKMGHDWADNCEHVAFGMVSLEDGTLSTRDGKIVLLEDVLNKAVEKTQKIIEEKSPDLKNKKQTAMEVGIGAVLYSTLSQSRIKDITFCFDRVLNFDGETGPYVQYTHARCASLLNNTPQNNDNIDYTVLNNDHAFEIIKLLDNFPNAILAASEKFEPFYVTRNITELAQAFNKYYYEYRIIDDNMAATNARIKLTEAVKNTLKQGLSLLGISAPEKM